MKLALFIILGFSAPAFAQISPLAARCHRVSVKVTPVELVVRPVTAPKLGRSETYGQTATVGHNFVAVSDKFGALHVFAQLQDGSSVLFNHHISEPKQVCEESVKVTLFFSGLNTRNSIENYRLEVWSDEELREDLIMPVVGQEVQRDQFSVKL